MTIKQDENRGIKGINQGVEQDAKLDAEQGVKQNAEQGTKQDVEQSVEQGINQNAGKNAEQGIIQSVKQDVEQNTKEGTKQNTEQSIKQGIKQFKKQDRFCTPGHKGRLLDGDVTETDDFPCNLIDASQKNAAKIFKTRAVRYLTNGSSIGIKAGLMACNGDILAAKNCHQSICEAAQLAGKKLFLVENAFENGLNQPLSVNRIQNALDENPSIGTVVLAHPDYYGLNSSLNAANLVKNMGLMLYVDGAHGAHYLFREDLFDCRIFALADAFNLSAHKTLYSLTQTAYLCINNPNLIGKIDQNLALLGTTSPFYPFYDSLECAIEYNFKYSRCYDGLKSAIAEFKQRIKCAANDDFTRLVVDAHAYNLDGKTLYDGLKNKRVIAEKYEKRYVVFIVTLADNAKKIKRLGRILEGLCNKQKENS